MDYGTDSYAAICVAELLIAMHSKGIKKRMIGQYISHVGCIFYTYLASGAVAVDLICSAYHHAASC